MEPLHGLGLPTTVREVPLRPLAWQYFSQLVNAISPRTFIVRCSCGNNPLQSIQRIKRDAWEVVSEDVLEDVLEEEGFWPSFSHVTHSCGGGTFWLRADGVYSLRSTRPLISASPGPFKRSKNWQATKICVSHERKQNFVS